MAWSFLKRASGVRDIECAIFDLKNEIMKGGFSAASARETAAPDQFKIHPRLSRVAATTREALAGAVSDDEIFASAEFSRDWFVNRAAWDKFLSPESDRIKKYLEIGAFEGRSALYASKLFPLAQLTCIDTFEGGGGNLPHLKEMFDNLEARFRKNIEPIKDRVRVLKGTSDKCLVSISDETISFDLIYIDGSHFYRNVLTDTLMSWPLLKVGGILIWDDYDFCQAQYGKRVPRHAIDQFLDIYEGDYEVIFVTSQVAIRKIKGEPPID